MTAKKKTSHGGPGRNQGRKPLPVSEKKKPLTISLTPRLRKKIDRQPGSASSVIERLIDEHL